MELPEISLLLVKAGGSQYDMIRFSLKILLNLTKPHRPAVQVTGPPYPLRATICLRPEPHDHAGGGGHGLSASGDHSDPGEVGAEDLPCYAEVGFQPQIRMGEGLVPPKC